MNTLRHLFAFAQPLMEVLSPPSAYKLAQEKLADYQRKQLESEEQAAFHAKMAEYYKEGITRLKKHREA